MEPLLGRLAQLSPFISMAIALVVFFSRNRWAAAEEAALGKATWVCWMIAIILGSSVGLVVNMMMRRRRKVAQKS